MARWPYCSPRVPCQQKLGGVVANGMVLSVNELVDGRAASAVDEISKQFERIRSS